MAHSSLPLVVQWDYQGTQGDGQGRTAKIRHSAVASVSTLLSSATTTKVSVSVTNMLHHSEFCAFSQTNTPTWTPTSSLVWSLLSLKHTGPTVGPLKCLGRLGTEFGNKSGVFSCVGSFWDHADIVCSDSTCEVWEGWLLAVGAIGYSDWLCASCMSILIGGVLANQYCVRLTFLCTPFCHFLFTCFGVVAQD